MLLKKLFNFSNPEIKIIPTKFDQFYQLADLLKIDLLKIKIEKEMEKYINQENAINYYFIGLKLGSKFICDICFKLLLQNIHEIIENNIEKLVDPNFIQNFKTLKSIQISNPEQNDYDYYYDYDDYDSLENIKNKIQKLNSKTKTK
ncbi:germ cell-less protein [Anaeramoeba ignava]|uniref:Germ cell-less protein n=1 Tax=Anaeramoeba ignava TaxID=1746090 RepID=A0A9Q0LCB2_ANAIG|nr:germ cell-less protein [Anaeramoeba ignava]